MIMGQIIFKGNIDETNKEWQDILDKSKKGYSDIFYMLDDDTFVIADKYVKITFSKREDTIYQIFSKTA